MSATDPGATDRRAAVTIGGHRGDLGAVRAGLSDRDDTVRAAALHGLVRLNAMTASDVAAAIGDPSPTVRRTICELARPGTEGDFASLLDDEAEVVESAAFALGEIGDRSAVRALAVVATSHTDPLCREAAVAALGAIGDPAAKPAVLAALADTNYVRRRAVVALAAFSGIDVDEALEERRHDRDWQVRQAAEDVIGLNRQIGN